MTHRKITFRKSIFLLFTVGMIATFIGCSSSKSTPTQTTNSGAQTISVSLSTTPTTLGVNKTTPVTATVANDSANAGVNWSCAPATTCGSFSSKQSASGTAVTYTAPAQPVNNVVITATSVTNTKISASTPAISITAVAPTITVALSTPPPSTLVTGATANIAATVTGDSANAGVNWSCAPANACGSFNPAITASAATTVYTAPSTAASVTITATSVTNKAQSASATVTITNSVATTLPAGNYVFSLAGTDAGATPTTSVSLTPYFLAGVFTVNNSGAITAGEQDFSDLNYFVPAEQITGGTITASSDGNLLITLTFADSYINGGSGTVTFDASLVSTSKALLIEYDNWATSSGELDLQTATLSTPSGGYAFSTSGWAPDISNPGFAAPFSWGGVINVDGGTSTPGGISGNGSVFDMNDQGGTTVISPDQLFSASTVSAPLDSFGLVNFTLNTLNGQQILLDGYIVDANHIRLIENQAAELGNSSALGGVTGGTTLGQGANTGNFTSTSISGNSYVVGTAGSDGNGSVQVAGVLTFNADGSVTGNLSFNDLSAMSPQGGTALAAETTSCSSGTAVTACYTIDPQGSTTTNDGGTGRVTITNVTDSTSSPTFLYQLQLYLDGNGHATVISVDFNDELAGLGFQQAATVPPTALSGSYTLDVTGVNSEESENDGVGVVAAALPNTPGGTGALTGFLDTNFGEDAPIGDHLSPDVALSATSATTATGGVFEISGTGGGSLLTLYLTGDTQGDGVIIENDPTQLTLGFFETQQ